MIILSNAQFDISTLPTIFIHVRYNRLIFPVILNFSIIPIVIRSKCYENMTSVSYETSKNEVKQIQNTCYERLLRI